MTAKTMADVMEAFNIGKLTAKQAAALNALFHQMQTYEDGLNALDEMLERRHEIAWDKRLQYMDQLARVTHHYLDAAHDTKLARKEE